MCSTSIGEGGGGGEQDRVHFKMNLTVAKIMVTQLTAVILYGNTLA